MENILLESKAEFKNGFRTLSFYGLYFLLAFSFEKLIPSELCGPGVGAFMLILSPAITIGLILYNAVMRIRRPDVFNRWTLIIHFVALGIFLLLMKQIS